MTFVTKTCLKCGETRRFLAGSRRDKESVCGECWVWPEPEQKVLYSCYTRELLGDQFMANEAVIIELFNGGRPIRYTVADGATIEKGTLMYLSADPRTIAASSGDGEIFVGVAAHEKVASDGATTLAVYTDGIFDLKDSGAGITLGNMAKLNGANLIATADEAGAQCAIEYVGQVLETCGAAEVVAVRVNK